MTPLAMHIWEQKRLPIAQRTFNDRFGALSLLDDFHCFDVSPVLETCHEMVAEMLAANDFDKSLCFLPAPRTWIEFTFGGVLCACLLVQRRADSTLTLFGKEQSTKGTFLPLGDNALQRIISFQADAHAAVAEGLTRRQIRERLGLDDMNGMALLCYAALALINGPGLCPQRKLHHSRPVARRLGLRVNGSFPLLAWTELTLRVGEGEQKSWTGGRQGGRTDMMPLHFVRAHRRRINGEWRKIEAFWRGNAALGIKQTRYKVKPRGSSNVS